MGEVPCRFGRAGGKGVAGLDIMMLGGAKRKETVVIQRINRSDII